MFGIKLESELDRKLAALASQQGKTKSDLVREAIRRFLVEADLAAQARRQSLLVSKSFNEQDTLDFFVENAADIRQWKRYNYS